MKLKIAPKNPDESKKPNDFKSCTNNEYYEFTKNYCLAGYQQSPAQGSPAAAGFGGGVNPAGSMMPSGAVMGNPAAAASGQPNSSNDMYAQMYAQYIAAMNSQQNPATAGGAVVPQGQGR